MTSSDQTPVPPRTGLDALRPTGIWGAVLLPITEAGIIDWGALRAEIEILCVSGLSGLYTNGTAAEFHNQTEAEFDRITAMVAEIAGAAGMPFQIGVCHSNARVARERLIRIAGMGAMGAQFVLPDWWPISWREVLAFVSGMQESAGDLPLILYNPPHAKVRLSLEQIAQLRRIAPGLVGAKLPGGDEGWYADRRRLLPDFSVFVAGHTIAFGRPLGADGAYSNVACLSPRGALLHWTLAGTDPDAARALEARIGAFMRTHIVPLVDREGLSHAALDKLMAEIGGWGPVSARLLWPHASASPPAIASAARAARTMLPEFFS